MTAPKLAPAGTVTRSGAELVPAQPASDARTAAVIPSVASGPCPAVTGSALAARLDSMKCCSSTAAASASTSSRRPRVEPPCSRMAARARAVLIRSSHSSTGSPVRRPIVRRHLPRGHGARLLGPFARERQAHDHAHRPVLAHQLEEAGHGKPLPRPAHQGLERGREDLGLVAQRQADADVAPVHGEEAAGGGEHGWNVRRTDGRTERRKDGTGGPGTRSTVRPCRPSLLPSSRPSPPYCAIVAKNSLLFLVRFIRSSRNSSASTGGMSARKLRRR